MSWLRNLKYYKYLFTGSPDEVVFGPIRGQILLVTIAFNNAEFIDLQIELLKKYFKVDFVHCVVDNSTKVGLKNEIKKICGRRGVSYFAAPKGIFTNQKSHGAAMHWSFFQVIRRFKLSYFGFLDHDIFPFKSFSLEGKYHQGIFGRVVNSYASNGYMEARTDAAPYWSLWAGFCFFDYSQFKRLLPWQFNFLSKRFAGGYFLDTGGGLWDAIFSKTDYPGILASYRKVLIDRQETEGDQNGQFEIFDESWIHFVSLSNWRPTENMDKKKENLLELLYQLSDGQGDGS